MTVLHITNDYAGSTVYKNLIGQLDAIGCRQIIYTPVKEEGSVGKNKIPLTGEGSKLIYSNILNKHIDRIFYKQKIKKIVADIEQKVDLGRIDIIHAHTWYSDGGVAYRLARKYSIPYIITIRNSDLNVFNKYLIHERKFGNAILEGAKNIILISASYRQRLLSLSSVQNLKHKIQKKLEVIPNGVDPYWIRNKVKHRKLANGFKKGFVDILYIGKFNKGKNVRNLINATELLNKRKLQYRLTLVGGGGNDQKNILKQIQFKSFIQYLGPIHDLDKLKTIFKKSDIFAMPSKPETFGLVYIEALLQGLPVIYTKNEGIDGFYDNSIGEKVESLSSVEIAHRISKVAAEYDSYNFNIEKIAHNHEWSAIANKYLCIFQDVKREE